MSHHYDIGIIGAGVLGSVTAFNLSKEFPNSNIAIFDRAKVSNECSNYAGAIISPINLSDAHKKNTEYSKNWYDKYLAQTSGLMRHLSSIFVCQEKTISALKDINKKFIPNMVNPPLPKWFCIPNNMVISNGGEAMWGNVREICQHLLYSAKKIKIFECTPIINYHQASDGWKIFSSDERIFNIDKLIIAQGAWIIKNKGFSDQHKLQTKKIVSFILNIPATNSDSLIYLVDEKAFLLPLPHTNQWMLSITSEHWNIDPESKLLTATKRERLIAENIIKRFLPSKVNCLLGSRSHCDSYIPQRMPISYCYENNLFMLAGGSGSGFRYAPSVARDTVMQLEELNQVNKGYII